MTRAEYSAPSPERQLAAVPPARFVAERDRLATAMGRAGDRAGAAALKKLKKPTRSVWALNQLAREEDAACEDLFAASDALSAVQQQAGGDVAAFREALARQRQQLDVLVARARALLEEAGEACDDATLARVTRGLRAASAGGEVREALREGRLHEDPEEPDFFSLAGAMGAGAQAAGPPRSVEVPHPAGSSSLPSPPSDGGAGIRQARLREASAEARRKATSAAEEATSAAAALEEARAAEDEAKRAREEAGDEVTRLRAALVEAESRAQELGATLGKRTRATAEATAGWRAASNRAQLLDEKADEAERALHGKS